MCGNMEKRKWNVPLGTHILCLVSLLYFVAGADVTIRIGLDDVISLQWNQCLDDIGKLLSPLLLMASVSEQLVNMVRHHH